MRLASLGAGSFINRIDFLEECSNDFADQTAIILSKGDKDLKAYLASNNGNYGLKGKNLRDCCAAAARCLQSVHYSNLVWTDMKADNLVVIGGGGSRSDKNYGIKVKGIDLESAMPKRENPVDYSPEACPPGEPRLDRIDLPTHSLTQLTHSLTHSLKLAIRSAQSLPRSF